MGYYVCVNHIDEFLLVPVFQKLQYGFCLSKPASLWLVSISSCVLDDGLCCHCFGRLQYFFDPVDVRVRMLYFQFDLPSFQMVSGSGPLVWQWFHKKRYSSTQNSLTQSMNDVVSGTLSATVISSSVLSHTSSTKCCGKSDGTSALYITYVMSFFLQYICSLYFANYTV